MYILIVAINGEWQVQGEYSQLEHVLSRIRQLDLEHQYLDVGRPTEYQIEVAED